MRNAWWKVGLAVLASPLLALLWLRLLPLALVGAVHTAIHYVTGRALGIPVKLQLGYGPPFWRTRRLDLAALPGAAARPVLESAPSARAAAYFAAGPAGTAIAGWLVGVAIFALAARAMPQSLPIVGLVEAESPADRAGLQMGDRILSIDGTRTAAWSEVVVGLERGGLVALRRSGRLEELEVPPLGIESGAASVRAAPVIAVHPAGAWERSGLRDRDRVLAIDGAKVDDWQDVAALLAEPIETVRVRRGDQDFDLAIEPGAPGVELADRIIGDVHPEGPAAAAGLRGGDRIVSLDGHRMEDWAQVGRYLRETEPPVEVVWERDGALHEGEIVTASIRVGDESIRRAGIQRLDGLYLAGEPATSPGFLANLRTGVESTHATIGRTLGTLASLATGRLQLTEPAGVLRAGASNALWLTGTVTTVAATLLTLFNLLPLPGSDLFGFAWWAWKRRREA